jgi:hypothetical protein
VTAAPPWINPDQRYSLNPPAIVLKLGSLPRAPDKLLGIAAALCYPMAERYRPGTGGGDTWCNLATIDFMQIARAPLPRMDHGNYLRANDLADRLRSSLIPGWSKTGTIASASAVISLANEGRPQLAIWKNPTILGYANGEPVLAAGHIMPVVPGPPDAKLPPGFSGVFVSGAGAICVHKVPIEKCFGKYTAEVEFYAYRE